MASDKINSVQSSFNLSRNATEKVTANVSEHQKQMGEIVNSFKKLDELN